MINKAYSDEIIEYYDRNAIKYNDDTVNIKMGQLDEFINLVKSGHILDLGCGSGRDSKRLLDSGFTVVSVDGSKELAKLATKLIGQPVICSKFQNFYTNDKFDGIWACASLLHLYTTDLEELLYRLISKNLNTYGIMYLGFKYGDNIIYREDRMYNNMTEEKLNTILAKIPSIKLLKHFITGDNRVDRQDIWLNTFIQKI